ncbi:MAG: hypothetical protein R3D67_05025 [Hyphomicrobiaceae bacterium]
MSSSNLLRQADGAFVPRARTAACIVMLGVAMLGAGCAAQKSQPYGVAGPTANAPPAEAGAMKVVIEADGLPSQLAPRNRPIYPDDPREPWSPNYGNAPAAEHASQAVPSPKIADVQRGRAAQKADPAMAPVTRISMSKPMDPDEVIRQAIAAHEMRQN